MNRTMMRGVCCAGRRRAAPASMWRPEAPPLRARRRPSRRWLPMCSLRPRRGSMAFWPPRSASTAPPPRRRLPQHSPHLPISVKGTRARYVTAREERLESRPCSVSFLWNSIGGIVHLWQLTSKLGSRLLLNHYFSLYLPVLISSNWPLKELKICCIHS